MVQDPSWREFERLIALIENHLGPKGAVIRSPDYIPDKVTGQLREVDASVRYQVGSVPILITIECRERASVQDVTWIEQLASKRDSLGAAATIAVSATGFSGPAKAKAKALGIETRVLRDVSDAAIRDWADHLEITIVRGRFSLVRTGVTLRGIGDESQPSPDPQIQAELARGDVSYRFIRRLADRSLIAIADLLREAEPKDKPELPNLSTPLTVTIPPMSGVKIPIKDSFAVLFDGVSIDASPTAQVLKWDFAVGEATVQTPFGDREILSLEAEFSVVQQSLPMNVGRLLSYETDDGPIAHVQQRELELGNGQVLKATTTGRADENKMP